MRHIRTKILTIAVGGLLFTSVVSTLATNMVVHSWLEERTIESVEEELEYIADYMIEPILTDDRLSIREIIERTMRGRPHIEYVFVISADGTIIGNSFVRGVPNDLLRANPLPGSGGSHVQVLHTERGSILDIVFGVLDGRAGEVHMGVNHSVIIEPTRKAILTLQMTQAGSLALAILACFLLADLIVRPINSLVRHAHRVAGGDFSARVRVRSNDEIGELERAFNVMVEELLRSQNRLKDLAEQAHGIVSSFPSALFVLDPHAIIQSVNPVSCELTMHAEDELVGESLSDLLVFSHEGGRVGDLGSALKREGITLSYDMAIRQADGKARPVAFQSAPMTGADGVLRGYVVEVRNIAQLHLAIEGLMQHRSLLEEQQRERLDQALTRSVGEQQAAVHLVRSDRLHSLGQLAASAAHEINNPLFGITTFARLIERELDTPDGETVDKSRLLNAARRIAAESMRCSNIMRGFLGYAHPGAATTEQVSLGVLFDDVDSLLAQKAKDLGVEVTSNFPDSDVVTVDHDQIHQVFLNITLNALQAMPDGGRLSVTGVSHPNEKAIDVIFADTGGGIPPEVIDKVFDPFFTTKEKGVGTGLGLAIARVLLRRHKGTIEIRRTSGSGTEVKVTLPLG